METRSDETVRTLTAIPEDRASATVTPAIPRATMPTSPHRLERLTALTPLRTSLALWTLDDLNATDDCLVSFFENRFFAGYGTSLGMVISGLVAYPSLEVHAAKQIQLGHKKTVMLADALHDPSVLTGDSSSSHDGPNNLAESTSPRLAVTP